MTDISQKSQKDELRVEVKRLSRFRIPLFAFVLFNGVMLGRQPLVQSREAKTDPTGPVAAQDAPTSQPAPDAATSTNADAFDPLGEQQQMAAATIESIGDAVVDGLPDGVRFKLKAADMAASVFAQQLVEVARQHEVRQAERAAVADKSPGSGVDPSGSGSSQVKNSSIDKSPQSGSKPSPNTANTAASGTQSGSEDPAKDPVKDPVGTPPASLAGQDPQPKDDPQPPTTQSQTPPNNSAASGSAAAANSQVDPTKGSGEKSAARKVVIVNPKSNGLPFQFRVGDRDIRLEPGKRHSIDAGEQGVEVRFDRGGDFGSVQRKLKAGTYRLRVSHRGWSVE